MLSAHPSGGHCSHGGGGGGTGGPCGGGTGVGLSGLHSKNNLGQVFSPSFKQIFSTQIVASKSGFSMQFSFCLQQHRMSFSLLADLFPLFLFPLFRFLSFLVFLPFLFPLFPFFLFPPFLFFPYFLS